MSKPDRNAPHNTAEIARIRGIYKTRDQGFLGDSKYTPTDAGYRCALRNRLKNTRNLLRKVGISTLEDLRILEVGSGFGTVMLEHSSLGADGSDYLAAIWFTTGCGNPWYLHLY